MRQLFRQPDIILVGECDYAIGDFGARHQRHEIAGRVPVRAVKQRDAPRGLGIGKIPDYLEGVVGRGIVADPQGPVFVVLPRDRCQLLRQEATTVVGGHQDGNMR